MKAYHIAVPGVQDHLLLFYRDLDRVEQVSQAGRELGDWILEGFDNEHAAYAGTTQITDATRQRNRAAPSWMGTHPMAGEVGPSPGLRWSRELYRGCGLKTRFTL